MAVGYSSHSGEASCRFEYLAFASRFINVRQALDLGVIALDRSSLDTAMYPGRWARLGGHLQFHTDRRTRR